MRGGGLSRRPGSGHGPVCDSAGATDCSQLCSERAQSSDDRELLLPVMGRGPACRPSGPCLAPPSCRPLPTASSRCSSRSSSWSPATIVGYEALARWTDPRLSDVSRVFQEAREGGYLAELDWPCRAAAFAGALAAGLDTRHALFVNVEPTSVRTGDAPAPFQPVLRRAERELRVVVELTERSLLDGPANVLALVSWARERGWRVALDDVGAHPDSLALLPLIAPDVIKLDLNLIQQTPSRDQARTITAVMAHAERTGATLLAEGIETEAHLDQALSLGATLGQGWLLGYPGPLVPTGPGIPLTVPRPQAPVAADTVRPGGHAGEHADGHPPAAGPAVPPAGDPGDQRDGPAGAAVGVPDGRPVHRRDRPPLQPAGPDLPDRRGARRRHAGPAGSGRPWRSPVAGRPAHRRVDRRPDRRALRRGVHRARHRRRRAGGRSAGSSS